MEPPSEVLQTAPPVPQLNVCAVTGGSLVVPESVVKSWATHETFGGQFQALLKEITDEFGLPEPAATKRSSSDSENNPSPAGKKQRVAPPPAKPVETKPCDQLPASLCQALVSNLKKDLCGKIFLRITQDQGWWILNQGSAAVQLTAGTVLAGFGAGAFKHVPRVAGKPGETDAQMLLFDFADDSTLLLHNGKLASVGEVVAAAAGTRTAAEVCYHQMEAAPSAGDGHQGEVNSGEGPVPQECHGPQVDCGRLMDVHEVESTVADTRPGRSNATSSDYGAAGDDSGALSTDRPRLCAKVCVHPYPRREPHDGVGTLCARARTSRGWWNHVAPVVEAHQQLGASSAGSPIASRQAGPLRTCVPNTGGNLVRERMEAVNSDSGPSLSTSPVVASPSSASLNCILRLALSNPSGTACYMNAAFLALLWSISFSTPGAPARYGGLTGMHQLAQARHSFDLHKQMGWKFLIGQWAQPFQQHDVHEFLLYLLPRLRLRCLSGFWATRRLDAAGVTTCDSSPTDMPITIDLPVDARGLQHCIQEWHSQHYRTALITAPPMLIFQLRRFRYDSCGRVSKDFQALHDLGDIVRVPMFSSSHDLAVQWKPYQVRAALLHTGEAASRGHYRSLLRNDENIWHITDDAVSATLQPSASLHHVSASAYVLICTEVLE